MADVANEIKNGFDALAGGVHEAGKRRIDELIKKQGYVAYKNKAAADMFRKDLDYIDYEMKEVDGEYRFYPPNKDKVKAPEKENEEVSTNLIVEKYKEAKKEYLNTRITIRMINDKICEYSLIAVNPRDGSTSTLQTAKFNFDGKFSKEILPSLYYHLSGGLPVVDYIKDNGLQFINIENDMIMFGGVNNHHLDTIYKMKDYVDEMLHLNVKQK